MQPLAKARYRYITDPQATRYTAISAVKLMANNQIPDDARVVFRVQLLHTTDVERRGGYSQGYDSVRLEEMPLTLKVKFNGQWTVQPLYPDNTKTLEQITHAFDVDMLSHGYVIDPKRGYVSR